MAILVLLPGFAEAQDKKVDKPRPAAKKKGEEKPWLTPQQAKARYDEAVKAERARSERHAFVAYLEAAENGHGEAQKKMGDIFSKGGVVVKRDYETSLRWYEKARAQGVKVPKPTAFTRGH